MVAPNLVTTMEPVSLSTVHGNAAAVMDGRVLPVMLPWRWSVMEIWMKTEVITYFILYFYFWYHHLEVII